ncbi:MAG: YebC/PmpR family DNA-binding transcriptional regulator [Chloroflexi bacterium]|nr:YebC/PmpR family DNA-binding transcriptional regulator [Chloroflexota bacterium]MYE39566.1 YebC/PmpR family DNA-binding transcriptional regulator [Chloroflexota bacterium]
MSGHSKWSTIKHQKGAADAKRGVLFTKLSREIALAVREGGGVDPDMNFKLRLALDRAKSNNMPQDSISRAVKRGSGEGSDGESLEQVTYEGYGPGGGAILLQAVTTNRNRTAAEVRSAFNRGGGNLGESGCVAWNFELRGVVTVDIEDEERAEELGLLAIDAGAEDIQIDEGVLEIYSPIESLQDVQKSVAAENVSVRSAELSMVPKTTIELADKEAEQTLRLLDTLEELDDIQKAFTNADFSPEVLERYQTG